MENSEGKGQEKIIEIRKSIFIGPSPKVGFKAITDPNEVTNWLSANDLFDGMIGGKVRFTFDRE
jgi:hypothetical protein